MWSFDHTHETWPKGKQKSIHRINKTNETFWAPNPNLLLLLSLNIQSCKIVTHIMRLWQWFYVTVMYILYLSSAPSKFMQAGILCRWLCVVWKHPQLCLFWHICTCLTIVFVNLLTKQSVWIWHGICIWIFDTMKRHTHRGSTPCESSYFTHNINIISEWETCVLLFWSVSEWFNAKDSTSQLYFQLIAKSVFQ